VDSESIASPETIAAELKHHRIQHLETLHTCQAIASQYFPDRWSKTCLLYETLRERQSQLSHVERYHYITLRQGIRIETEWLA
jgi:Virulence activator alpha C-term